MFCDISTFSSDGHLVYRRGTLFTYFGREPIRHHSVKTESNRPKGLGVDSI